VALAESGLIEPVGAQGRGQPYEITEWAATAARSLAAAARWERDFLVGGAGQECPANSIYGHARAITPLLDRPLEGPVYLRSSSHQLPDLVADLNGQIHVVLDGRIDSANGGIRTTFSGVPDVPVKKFVLRMKGGAKGLLVNSTSICGRAHRAVASFVGQNGKVDEFRPLLAGACGRTAKGH
jgi:hypothetical protein